MTPFNRPVLSAEMRQKKTFIPTKRTCNRFLWDKSLENFCGATQIGDTIARSAVCKHIPFLGNGGKARRRLIGAPAPFGPPSAVHSPELFLPPLHCRRLAGRNALWVLLCLIGFCFELGDSINPGTAVVNPPPSFFSDVIKFAGETGPNFITPVKKRPIRGRAVPNPADTPQRPARFSHTGIVTELKWFSPLGML